MLNRCVAGVPRHWHIDGYMGKVDWKHLVNCICWGSLHVLVFACAYVTLETDVRLVPLSRFGSGAWCIGRLRPRGGLHATRADPLGGVLSASRARCGVVGF